MTITSNDIKLYQAQDNTDNDSGGGARTSVEIVDGDVNNLFPDISRIDTVSGDVALRKIFPTVTTDNNDVYYGAHAMIRKPPADPNVSSLLFYTNSSYDQRIDAQDKIESYVVASYIEEFYLYGKHVVGAKSITFLQTLSAQTPEVGEVYLIKHGNDEQYVRVASIDVAEVTLSYSWGGEALDYVRRRIICEIDQALEFPFAGSSFHPSGQVANTANTWATQVADAAKFYSTKPLVEDALTGDVKIKVDSIFEQIVPASKKQTPLVNQDALSQGESLLPTGNVVTENYSVSVDVPVTLNHSIVPNSIVKVVHDYYQDDGLGNLINTNTQEIIGSVDYKSGIIIQAEFGGGVTITYEIATKYPSKTQFTSDIKITQENVGNVFTRRLSPMPSIGDLYVDYRSNGKWYRFTSTGSRESGVESIGGDNNIGGGQLNDNTDGTGTVSITLSSTPDIDSSVIISWGSSERITDRQSTIASETECYMSIPLGKSNIDPLSFNMLIEGDNVTATASGALVDSVNTIYGRLDYINGQVVINRVSGSSGRFPPPTSSNDLVIDFDYSDADPVDSGGVKAAKAHPSPTNGELPFTSYDEQAGLISFNIGATVELSTVLLRFSYKAIANEDHSLPDTITLESDGAGVLRKLGRISSDTTTYGSVNTNGVVNLEMPFLTYKAHILNVLDSNVARYSTSNNTKAKLVQDLSGDYINVTYRTGTPVSYSLTHNITNKYSNLIQYKIKTAPSIVGEVAFNFLDDIPLHSKNGVIVTGDNTQVGSIDYATGSIGLTYFSKPYNLSLEFVKLFTDDITEDGDYIGEYAFRTAATKLTTSSFQFYYTTANGTFIATSDGNGVITGTDIDSNKSYVDTQTGMASILFTTYCIPSSFKYDAVAESSLPLNPELLGLNPVRLPSDGRVPVFKSGYHLIVFNEVETATTNATPLANDVETLARSGQAYVEVIDANGKRLNPTQYIADRALGTITFSSTLLLEDKYNEPLTAPFYIVDRVEDMLLATDVQINGLISLSGGLSHDYSFGETYVASSLVWGDTGARYYNLFSQEIWDSGNPVWDDHLVGDNTTAQYDDLNNSIQINNKSSTSGRWAIIFKSDTTVDVVHEALGVVQSNVSISIDDVRPVNPATGEPYFTMPKEGFGAGWRTNNVIRFNTESGDNNAWVIRTVQSGALSELTDSIDIEVRGDAN